MERGYGRPGKCKFRTSYMYMYVFCPNWDTTGTRPIIPGLSRPFRMVGNYANKDYTLNNNIFMHIQCTRTGVTCQKVCMHVTVDNCFKNMCMKTSFCSILKVTKWPANSSLKKHWVVCTMVHSVSDLQPLSPPPPPISRKYSCSCKDSWFLQLQALDLVMNSSSSWSSRERRGLM